MAKKAKVLFVDIETAPIIGFLWGMWDQNLGLNQINSDWHLLSFAAQWQDSKEIMYADQRGKKNIENDKHLLRKLWKLMNDADIIIGHNSKRFDVKKLNARFLQNGMSRPAPFEQVDTLLIARKHFALTSNKLEYLSNILCPEMKKSSHKKYPGFELWKECMAGNVDAFSEMEKYNKQDIVALEGVYNVLRTWDNTVSFAKYGGEEAQCNCGSTSFQKRGFAFSNSNKYQRYQCKECKAWFRGRKSIGKKSVLVGV
jgi:uncharacterized protein YprB with RNaseH-like and TPR domain